MSSGKDAGGGAGTSAQKLREENSGLKQEILSLSTKIRETETELQRSNDMVKKLEALSKELEHQSKSIKEESLAQIKEAEVGGKNLATEVNNSMWLMANMSKNLEKTSSESLEIRKASINLAQEIENLRKENETKEELLQKQLSERSQALIQIRTEIAEARLKNAQDKERLFEDMHRLAESVVESREQIKASKETELQLRQTLQEYDQKFIQLHKSLHETNASYDEFKGEMGKVCERAKGVEKETNEWQLKWEESSKNLIELETEHTRLQNELGKTEVGLTQMNNLFKALQNQKDQMLGEMKKS